jgi:phage terminase large subunit-like protein
MNDIPWHKILTFTPLDLSKIVVTAFIIVLVNKIQLFSDRLSALLIALPFTSLLAMIWMHQAGQSPQRVANHAEGTFWFVLPTLPMFLIFPWMLRQGWGFWSALAANCLLTVAFFWITVIVLRRFGVDLMPK